MNILHVYDENDHMSAQYVDMLTTATASYVTMRSATSIDAFRQHSDKLRPDIVHVHAKPSFSLPQGLRLVVTPHGSPLTRQNAYVVVARSKMEYDELTKQCKRVEIVLNPIITRTTSADTCAPQMLRIYQRIMDSSVLQLMNNGTGPYIATTSSSFVGSISGVRTTPSQSREMMSMPYSWQRSQRFL